ncbi:uncharacterized protein LOC120186852 [Hibiscus syriacus]|uniref:uncharacterized protein LOC120186852 n=1 Tax=Hibiscus syriacus TaxID=106335 RepID=UPI0019236C05|nr:uncharacterized protein LOC120186852 [Hibiscus syriacus]
MGEFGFRQRWEFRRNDENDLDSSFNDSISSDGSLIRKKKLVSRLISLGDDENSEGSRLKQKEDEKPGKAGQINVRKAKKRTARNKSCSKMKKDSPEEVDLQKGETSAQDHAPLDELKNFMECLLKDLKVTRESLLKWMIDEVQQLVGDLRRKPGQGDEKVQLPKRKKSSKDQHGKTHTENMQSHRSSNSDKCIQVQCHTDLQQQNNTLEKIKQQVPIQDNENNNLQHKNDFGYGMDRSLVRFPTGFTAPASTGYLNPLGDQLGSGQFVELITSSNGKGDSLSMAAKPSHQTSDAGQNVQAKSNTSVVLAIEAQKPKGGSIKRSAKGKKTVDLGDHHQVPKDQAGHGQAIRTAGASTNVEELGSSVQNLLSSPFGQVPWSMYPMLPTFLTDQIAANQRPDALLNNYVLPRSAETKSCMNAERVNQMLEPGSSRGSFPVISPEETIRRFALTGSRNMDRINPKSTPSSSGIGTGFPFPLHQGIDFGLSIPNPRQFNPQNLPQETGKPLGLKMNGGAAKVSGGSYNLSEHITANNHHGNPTYKSDGRLSSYQMQNLKDGHLFLQ